MPVSDAEFAALLARVQRLEILVRQLQEEIGGLHAVDANLQAQIDAITGG